MTPRRQRRDTMTDTQTTAAANKTTLTDRLELLTVRGEIVP